MTKLHKVVLVGQPNCGKSTLFNSVAGYKVQTGNFPGTTVSYSKTKVRILNELIELTDLPGTYSLIPLDLSEKITRDYIMSREIDLVLNVVDATQLGRSLKLTLQLLETGIPVIVVLNMYDEAIRKGLEIDEKKLSELLGINVRKVIAVKGLGIKELFHDVLLQFKNKYEPLLPKYDIDVEDCINSIIQKYEACNLKQGRFSKRFIAIRLLEMDDWMEKNISSIDFIDYVKNARTNLAKLHGWTEENVFLLHRHAIAMDIYEKVTRHGHKKESVIRELFDKFFINPVGGLIGVIFSVFLTFYVAFWLGDRIGGLLESPFSALREWYMSLGLNGAFLAVISGLCDGIEAGIGIVIPYLVPLLILMSIYEDSGLLARVAFMLDGIAHRFGLHGRSIISLALGFGCNVPAILSCRNLENERERKLTMLIIPFIVCSARTVVILGLCGKYLGPIYVAFIYFLSIVVSATVLYILSRIIKETDFGFIMEVPPLRKPYFSMVIKKVWLKLYEFLVVAWPIVIVSSIILSLGSLIGMDHFVNLCFKPLTTGLMKLPEEVGITLFLGIFRKELTLLMLSSALSGKDVVSSLGTNGIITLTVFTIFYIPCFATLLVLKKEGGIKLMIISAFLNFFVAIFLATLFASVIG